MRNINLKDGWYLLSSQEVQSDGAEISDPNFEPLGWHPCRIPTTVLAALWELGLVNDPYFADELHRLDAKPYQSPWWFVTSFKSQEIAAKSRTLLEFAGINYRTNIWLNRTQLYKTRDEGPFRQLQFDISSLITEDQNTLAVEVIPALPGDFNIGFVDWNPAPPDHSMGIFRGVKLVSVGHLSLSSPFVETEDLDEGHNTATLRIFCLVTNHSNRKVSGELRCLVAGAQIKKDIVLNPNEKLQVQLAVEEFPELKLDAPKLWWPTQLGDPNLHDIQISAWVDNEISDQILQRFGIRTVRDFITPEGHRGFNINGRDLLIKGAGWTDDIFLRDTPQSLRQQVAYVSHMHLNCIRLEGFWGKDQHLFDLCDEYGILVMIGWSCHWEHEQYLGKPVDSRYGGVTETNEIKLISRSWEDQLLWLRHHPCIFVWTVASDMVPHPDLEKCYIETFDKYDRSRPYLNSTGGIGSDQGIVTTSEVISDISGSSRVKMLGPYAYTPPIYWYTDQNLGGAYGFNTETCPGANIPVLETLERMLPPEHIWPIDQMWERHCGLNSFATLDRICTAIEKRYGLSTDLASFSMKSQVLNYELMRPMFEAFQAHRPRSTGVIQWMLNSAWTSMYWQLYDAYLNPTAAFYAARKACEPLHLIYNYGTDTVQFINENRVSTDGLTAKVKLFDLSSNIILEKQSPIQTDKEFATSLVNLSNVLSQHPVSFLDLRLIDGDNREISNNFYWLSSIKDVLDYEAVFEDWPYYTPTKVYANFQMLANLPPSEVKLSVEMHNSSFSQIKINVSNGTGKIAFFLWLQLIDLNSGYTIKEALLEDNYFSLLPYENKTILVSVNPEIKSLEQIEVQIAGWNITKESLEFKLPKFSTT